MGSRRRAVVVLTEGATPRLLERWCERGWLPNFSRLLAEGASGPLAADGVPYEPPGLVSLLTGRRPGDHGFYSYWSSHAHDYRPRVLGTERHRHPLLWQHEAFAGLRFASIGLFGTHPPAPLDGWLVTYPMQQTLRACHPPDLQRWLAARGVKPVHDVSIWWSGQARDLLLPRLLEADRRRGRAAALLWDEGADVVLVNLTSIDRCSHIYWQELEPSSDREESSAILAAYRTCDGVLGTFLDRLDGGSALLAFSEIGFGPLRAYVSVDDELARLGLLGRDDGGVVWDKTAGFEAVQGTHGVNVNLRERYARGTVAPSDYERVRGEIADGLLEAINPRTGLPLLSAVHRREEVYGGEALDEAPDLVLEPADWRYLPRGEASWAAHVRRDWQSGWHRRESYWAAAGAGVRRGRSAGPARPVDAAAWLCRMLGRDLPGDFAGTPLGEAP